MVKLIWRLSEVVMEETWQIKLLDNPHNNLSIKSQ